MDESSFGVLWNGQYEALNRLILGLGNDACPRVRKIAAVVEAAQQPLPRTGRHKLVGHRDAEAGDQCHGTYDERASRLP
jgi:hypothetical protein